MLTISQLAHHAGVTVRAVRHYHAKGLLPEPPRDHSGYRRYGAADVAEVIRIRVLADAGVPLVRVRELLVADEAEFAAALAEVDRRLRVEISERQEHRRRVAQLVSGDGLALPPEALAYFARMRGLGFSEQMVEVEQEAWTIIAAQVPAEAPMLMAMKLAQLDDPVLLQLYRLLDQVICCTPDDPGLPELADRLAALFDTLPDMEAGDDDLDDELVELLDSSLVESVPSARRLLRLLEDRGWSGFTRIRRTTP